MTFKEQYEKRKPIFLNDATINRTNRELFKSFFEWEENKLKRTNGLRELDESSYKTLYEYFSRLKSVNEWFKNKSWKALTKADITKVYNDLEDGKIKTVKGKPFLERKNFYNKIFKSKPFELAGKADISREVIEFYKPRLNSEVRFIEEEDFLKLQRTAIKQEHKLLFWLAWDIGENVNSLLNLKKKNVVKHYDPYTQTHEYLVNLPREILKRTRTSRSEPTLYNETVELLDEVLKHKEPEDYLFNFDYKNATKIFNRSVRIAGVKCKPRGETPTFKDLRSSMACHLLRRGWSTDEVNARLGHKPASQELNKYINFLSLNRHVPKKKLNDNQLQALLQEIEAVKGREKLTNIRFKAMQEQLNAIKETFTKE